MRRNPLLLALAFTLGASLGLAASTSELLGKAAVIRAAYSELQLRVDDCPDGGCGDSATIRAVLAALSVQREALRVQALELAPAELGAVAESLDAIDRLADVLEGTVGEWNDED